MRRRQLVLWAGSDGVYGFIFGIHLSCSGERCVNLFIETRLIPMTPCELNPLSYLKKKRGGGAFPESVMIGQFEFFKQFKSLSSFFLYYILTLRE